MADRIFISYRRSGSPKDANMIFDHLVKVFGAERVFMDVDGIDPGDDFVEVIERQLDTCTVLLALIGPDWLHAADERGQRKLDDDEDFVRVEIRTALDRKMRVIPLLLDGAGMPRKPDLPVDLHPLTRKQGLQVEATKLHDFRSAMGRLVQVLNQSSQPAAAPDAPQAAPPPVEPKQGQPAARPPITPAIGKPRSSWMSDQGKDHFGHWAELTVKGVVQRLRWIEPGEFWMGSTNAEKRFGLTLDDESPRHRVHLTKGFWLADTTCTQDLWQALVGDNPSHFKGNLNLPVEQVSWYDVTQKFLPAVSSALGLSDLCLPTEAQWEHACRAGTETAYAFGDAIALSKADLCDHNLPIWVHDPRTGSEAASAIGHVITPEQVNYNGNFPPPGGKKGLYREKTVPVKALHANGWGMYQMHGNVWEWCADAMRMFLAEQVADPDGGQEPSRRVVRGGSWILHADDARSACRFARRCAYRAQDLGFRLSLRSPGPEAGGQ
jgi:formylglycine-generating enzyme required for sulfatase activity